MPAAIEEVMRRARVSRATAYRALNGTGPVSETTRRRVFDVVSELGGVVPQRAGRSTRRLALWLPGLRRSLGDPHHLEVVVALEEVAAERGLTLEIINAPVPEDPAEAVALVRRAGVAGVLALAVYGGRQLAALAEHWPVVLYFAKGRARRLTTVAPDDFAAGFRAAQHLLEAGHRRIAVAVGAGRSPEGFSERFVGGYVLALAEAGVAFDEKLVLRGSANLEPFSKEGPPPPAAAEFLKLKPRPTALIGRGTSVRGVMHAFAERGVRVPRDVSVIAYGPYRREALPLAKLTAMSYSSRAAAEAGLDALAAAGTCPRHVVLPVDLEPGESVRDLHGTG